MSDQNPGNNPVYYRFLRDPDKVKISSYHLDIRSIKRGINSGIKRGGMIGGISDKDPDGISAAGYQSLFYCKISGILTAIKNSKIITLDHLYKNTFIETKNIQRELYNPHNNNRFPSLIKDDFCKI